MRLSLRLRLTCWYAASLIVLLSIFGGLIDGLMHERLLARTDFELDEELHELALEIRLAKSINELRQQLEFRFGDHKAYEFRVETAAEESIFNSRRLGKDSIPRPQEFEGETIDFVSATLPELGDSRIASQRVSTSLGPMTVQVIMPLGLHLAELTDLRWLMLAVGPLMVLVSIAGGYWLARRALAPVDRMTQAAARINAQQLNERLVVANSHDELGRLATTFNGMLDRLEESFAELQNFTADAAHEFRTPLAVMRTSLEVALRSPRSTEYYQNRLQDMAEEVERLTSLSNQLLLLAREDAGFSDGDSECIDLGNLIGSVADDLESLADEKSLIINCPLSANVLVQGSPEPLRRVFLNLLDNAIKASPPSAEIELELTVRNGRAIVTVTDEGPGIPAAHLPHIFERFYRSDPSRSRETGGTGLGLAICRAVVSRHGGAIRVESEMGHGTRFLVELPLLKSKRQTAMGSFEVIKA